MDWQVDGHRAVRWINRQGYRQGHSKARQGKARQGKARQAGRQTMCRFLHCLRSGLGISSLYEVRALSRSTSLEHNTEGTRPKRVDATIDAAEDRDSMDAIMWSKRGMASVFLK